MRVDTPEMDTFVPDDDHRIIGFPFHLVFDAAVYILESMGLHISYSNIYQGRIVAAKGVTEETMGGHLDIKLIGRGSVTLVHVRTGSGTVSGKDDTDALRRRFLWDLAEWLHKAKVEELDRVQKKVADSHGKPSRGWVPSDAVYKIRPHCSHRKGNVPAGLVWVPAGRTPGSGGGSPKGASAGLRGWWGPNPTPGGLLPSRGHRDQPPRRPMT
jgi:hypothetical protein